jgi:hypothetical protein
MYCHNRTCLSDHEQTSLPPFHHYTINNNEQEMAGGSGEYQCLSVFFQRKMAEISCITENIHS